MSASRGEKASIRFRFLLIAASLAVVAGGAVLYWYQAEGSGSTVAARPPRPAVRVSIAVATRQDVAVYATGLGTVQASFTIGIHSQVEGIMQEVLFTEGQHVKKGDVLARIDPRLFQAALDQAKAKRMQDIALLGAAEKDLARSKTLVVQNVATQQLVDQQQARVDQLKASTAADEAAIETAQTQVDYGPDWVHEIKHDGYRLIVRRDGEVIRLFTRRGYDWTDRYPAIARAVREPATALSRRRSRSGRG